MRRPPAGFTSASTVKDSPGVLAQIADVLGHYEISIASVLQHEAVERRRRRAAGDHDAQDHRRRNPQGVQCDRQARLRRGQHRAHVGPGLGIVDEVRHHHSRRRRRRAARIARRQDAARSRAHAEHGRPRGDGRRRPRVPHAPCPARRVGDRQPEPPRLQPVRVLHRPGADGSGRTGHRARRRRIGRSAAIWSRSKTR